MTDPTKRLLELDERHNRLLEQLAELDRQASNILDDWVKTKKQCEQNERIDQAMTETLAVVEYTEYDSVEQENEQDSKEVAELAQAA